MSNKKQAGTSAKTSSKPNKNIAIIAGIAVVAVLAIFFIAGSLNGDDKKASDASDSSASNSEATQSLSSGKDLVISKAEITETAKFYPLEADGTKMEVLAVKAEDGSIRTAFNTCQVCNGSPRAYYIQDGDVMVCQNCGNRFSMDMIEVERGGCNPVPIMKENKTEDNANIIISKDFISQNKGLFTDNWKTE